MKVSFRWYGLDDPVTLENIRQIPGIHGIVTAIYDIPVGEVWPIEKIVAIKDKVAEHGLALEVIESVPVHEDIKLGLDSRDKYIENFNKTLINLGKVGIKTVCYNFMPVFDWTRSNLNKVLEDGSTALAYEHETVLKMNPINGDLDLPGWSTEYSSKDLTELLNSYKNLSEEDLWENLEYFLKKVVPVAEKSGIRLAIHPDDPPWSIFGLPRIVTSKESLERIVEIIDSPSNGVTVCTGSLGANPANNLPDIIREFASRDRLNFLHFRNIKIYKNNNFVEVAHLSKEGSLDMFEIIKAAVEKGYRGPIRPDHGRMIWGEKGKPGYGLFDRALGAAYINGLLEAITRQL